MGVKHRAVSSVSVVSSRTSVSADSSGSLSSVSADSSGFSFFCFLQADVGQAPSMFALPK